MPYIEEVDDDDIDNKHYSISDFDSHNPFSKDTPVDADAPVQLVPTTKPQSSSASRASSVVPSPGDSLGEIPGAGGSLGGADSAMLRSAARDIPEHMKSWKVLYPVYFDKQRTVKHGRRVPVEFAVDNPLAVTLADACRSLGFEPALELTKTHPKDWANPGRVRVNYPGCKRELYGKIAKYLKATKVDSVSARERMYRQVAQFDSLKPLAVPRNMTMPKILPGFSPALSAAKMIDESMSMGGNDMAKMMGLS